MAGLVTSWSSPSPPLVCRIPFNRPKKGRASWKPNPFRFPSQPWSAGELSFSNVRQATMRKKSSTGHAISPLVTTVLVVPAPATAIHVFADAQPVYNPCIHPHTLGPATRERSTSATVHTPASLAMAWPVPTLSDRPHTKIARIMAMDHSANFPVNPGDSQWIARRSLRADTQNTLDKEGFSPPERGSHQPAIGCPRLGKTFSSKTLTIKTSYQLPPPCPNDGNDSGPPQLEWQTAPLQSESACASAP